MLLRWPTLSSGFQFTQSELMPLQGPTMPSVMYFFPFFSLIPFFITVLLLQSLYFSYTGLCSFSSIRYSRSLECISCRCLHGFESLVKCYLLSESFLDHSTQTPKGT